MIKVMCVDDQVLLRETLIYMLSQDDEIETVDGGGSDAMRPLRTVIYIDQTLS